MSISLKFKRRWEPSRPGQVIILDNRDSFVYNLAHRLGEAGEVCAVVRSDEVDLEQLKSWDPAALIISPGPGHPRDAGISVEAIRHFHRRIPILGVCLGHQAIAFAFGGVVEPNRRPVHGMATTIEHDGSGLFRGMPREFPAARYHSLVVGELPEELEENAWSDGFVMGLKLRDVPVFGVQFHPESILTPLGVKLLKNFIAEVE